MFSLSGLQKLHFSRLHTVESSAVLTVYTTLTFSRTLTHPAGWFKGNIIDSLQSLITANH